MLTGFSSTVASLHSKVSAVTGKSSSIRGHFFKAFSYSPLTSSKKTFTDMSGAEIFVLAEKKLKLFKTFHAESPAGHNFDVEGHFSIGSSKSTVKFVNAADKVPIELQVKGDWFGECGRMEPPSALRAPLYSVSRKSYTLTF